MSRVVESLWDHQPTPEELAAVTTEGQSVRVTAMRRTVWVVAITTETPDHEETP